MRAPAEFQIVQVDVRGAVDAGEVNAVRTAVVRVRDARTNDPVRLDLLGTAGSKGQQQLDALGQLIAALDEGLFGGIMLVVHAALVGQPDKLHTDAVAMTAHLEGLGMNPAVDDRQLGGLDEGVERLRLTADEVLLIGRRRRGGLILRLGLYCLHGSPLPQTELLADDET